MLPACPTRSACELRLNLVGLDFQAWTFGGEPLRALLAWSKSRDHRRCNHTCGTNGSLNACWTLWSLRTSRTLRTFRTSSAGYTLRSLFALFAWDSCFAL